MDSRLNKPLVLAMVAVALVLGFVLVGMTTGIADRIFGGPKAETIASASLQWMRTQKPADRLRGAIRVGHDFNNEPIVVSLRSAH